MQNKGGIVMLGTAEESSGGIAAVVAAYRRAGLFERWPITYIRTHRDGSLTEKIWLAGRAYVRLLSLLLTGRVTLLHVHSASNASFWRKSGLITMALVFGRPVIFHLHGGGFSNFYAQCSTIKKWIISGLLDRAAVIVVVSDYWRKPLSVITRNSRIVRIYNPLSDEMLVPAKRMVDPCPRVLFLGRLNRQKGLFDLLDAFQRIHEEFPMAVLDLCGDGDGGHARSYARRLGIDDAVQIHGWISGARKRELLEAASVFVLPSYIEGLPMAMLEAMAVGLPVIVARVGGIPDVVEDDKDGILIKPGAVDEMAAALKRLLADGPLRRKMGEAASTKIAERFLPTRILLQIEALYAEFGASPRTDARRAAVS